MSQPIISRIRRYYRIKFWTPTGIKGIDDGGWILDAQQPARNGEAPGVIKPTEFNTGTLFSRARSKYTGSTILNQNNKIYRDLDFYDFVKVTATGTQFINCGFYGSTAWPTQNLPLVECTTGVDAAVTAADPWLGLPYFEGCTFKPQRPNYYTDGIRGSFVANECSFMRLRNGVTIDSSDNTRRARARVESCYISDLVFWHPIPGGSSIANQGINIVAAGDIRVIGNYVRATAFRGDDRNFGDPDGATAAGGTLSNYNPSAIDSFSQPNGSHANGAGIRVIQTRSLAFDSAMVITDNWFANGMMGADLVNGTYSFARNKFRQNGFYRRSTTQYYIKLAFTGTPNIVGLNTNVFEETNQPLTSSNGGIQ